MHFLHQMEVSDQMFVRLHEGALKGGGTHAFTSLVGMLVGNNHETSNDFIRTSPPNEI
jgi:hypothetical protein